MHATLMLLVLATTAPAASDLESRISAYWDLLVKQDKASALEFVTPDTRNHFINRREPAIVGWEVVKVARVSDDEALVEVRVNREIPGMRGVFPIEVIERWVRGDQWQVAVQAPKPPKIESPISLTAAPKPIHGQLAFQPEIVRIPFFNPRRRGIVHVMNGLTDNLRVSGVEYDHQRFKLEAPEAIPAGESRTVVLEYVGDEVPKNLTSRLDVTLEDEGGTAKTLQIAIVYNYFSDGARALFGLTPEEADKVRRDDKLRPAVSTPATREAQEKARRLREEKSSRPPAPSTE